MTENRFLGKFDSSEEIKEEKEHVVGKFFQWFRTTEFMNLCRIRKVNVPVTDEGL